MTVPPFETHECRGRLLLIEETSVLREIELLLLRSAGFHLITCAEPEQALGHIDLHPIDLVVINSDRPELHSGAFITALRQHRPMLRVVAFTWSANVQTSEELRRNGVTVVLDRPVNPATLLQQIDALMETSPTPTAREYVELSAIDACQADRKPNPARPGTDAPDHGTNASAKTANEDTLQPYLRVPAVGTISTIAAASTRSVATRSRS